MRKGRRSSSSTRSSRLPSGTTKNRKSAKRIRARLEHEEREALKHIDERFDHIIRHLDPKEVHHQLEEALHTLRHIRETMPPSGKDDLNYDGLRAAAHRRIEAAEHQLRRTLEHDTHEERAKAARDIHDAHVDIEKALSYSLKKHAAGGKTTPEKEKQYAAVNQLLQQDLPMLDRTHHLLMAVDHEIKDYEHEKRELRRKRDEIKKQVHEDFHARIQHLDKEIAQEEHQRKELEHQHNEAKKQLKEQYAGQIKGLENQIKSLEKK